MADNERKKLPWARKKKLFQLFPAEPLQLTKIIAEPHEQDRFDEQDEESCTDYIYSYIGSSALLQLEDEGLSQLLELQDIVDEIIAKKTSCNVAVTITSDANVSQQLPPEGAYTDPQTIPSAIIDPHESQSATLGKAYGSPIPQGGAQPATQTMTDIQHVHTHQTQSLYTTPPHSPGNQCPTYQTESMIALNDLPFLQKREFKIHGGQIGDHTSDITYNSISKQMDQFCGRRTEKELSLLLHSC